MNWLFWKKGSSKKDKLLLNKVKEMEDKLTNLESTVSELNTNNKQMTRLQYKYNQEIKKALDRLNKRFEEQQKSEEQFSKLVNYIENYRSIIDNNIETLVGIIDEIDLIRQGLNEDEGSWSQILEKWTNKLLELLEKQDIYEIDLLGRQFDPRVAEAISTLSKKEIEQEMKGTSSIYKNYDIVEVLKRGYRNSNGDLIRKASVITFKEENDEQNKI